MNGQTNVKPLKVIVGAGGDQQEGFISLDQYQLDITDLGQWASLFYPNSIDVILAEHVFEHLTPEGSFNAARNFFFYLKSGGYARICVPDGLHPDQKYQAWVAPGTGWSGDSHKQLFDYQSLSRLLWTVGFTVYLREYWDENGELHSSLWDEHGGRIKRCSRSMHSAIISMFVGADYTSLLVDAVRP
ncbi:MAG: hypothetical protein J2P41_00240 [Blastocatellia bacterium]|nr:hypothetical protein [Blastocatellia bacterium]